MSQTYKEQNKFAMNYKEVPNSLFHIRELVIITNTCVIICIYVLEGTCLGKQAEMRGFIQQMYMRQSLKSWVSLTQAGLGYCQNMERIVFAITS